MWQLARLRQQRQALEIAGLPVVGYVLRRNDNAAVHARYEVQRRAPVCGREFFVWLRLVGYHSLFHRCDVFYLDLTGQLLTRSRTEA